MTAMTAAASLHHIEFEIVGLPTPQGSKTRMPNGALLDGRSRGARDRHHDWRTAIATTARTIATNLPAPLDGALALEVDFRFPMPAARPKRIREAGINPKVSAPDLDKLVRALGDGLQAGGLIRDDARLALVTATKWEVIGWTGAEVRLRPFTEVMA